MGAKAKITIEIFKTVTKAIAQSDNLDLMTNHLARLLVAALDIKGCTIFVLNPETEELEVMATYGLSPKYLSKGPVLADRSIGCTMTREPIVIRDVTSTKRLQYPADAQKEGIGGIVSLPIIFNGEAMGVLRLYHREVWDILERDLDSLQLLAETIGLAMAYTRLLNAVHSITEVITMAVPVDSLPLPKN